MRKHYVACQIVGEIQENLGSVQDTINRCYVNSVKNILNNSDLSKEERIRMINCIQKNMGKYKENNYANSNLQP